MSRKGKQSDLGTSLGGLMRKLDKKSGGAFTQTRIAEAWMRVAGPSVTRHTTGAHLREGELVIYVDSSVWATELSALAEMYRTRINEDIGQTPVRSVRFTVSKKVGEERRFELAAKEAEEFYTEDKVEPVPLSEQERAQIEDSVSAIEDTDLRDAVLRATIADFEWKKALKQRKDRETPREGL